MTIEVLDNDGDVMYFIGNREVLRPVLLKEPVTLKDGRVIVSTARGARTDYILTREDLGDFQPTVTIDTSDWLLQLGQ